MYKNVSNTDSFFNHRRNGNIRVRPALGHKERDSSEWPKCPFSKGVLELNKSTEGRLMIRPLVMSVIEFLLFPKMESSQIPEL